MANIIKVSEATALAFHAITIIASKPEETFSARDMADKLAASYDHLVKVLQRLQKDGFIESVRGPKGGFKLLKPAAETTLYDIFRTIEGDIDVHNCLFHKPVCKFNRCFFGDIIGNLRKQLLEYLENTTISQVLEDGKEMLLELS